MSQVSLRQIQQKVITKVLSDIKNGKTDIFIQAPTGTGKGLIALELAKTSEAYILTSEKALQRQYEEDSIKYETYSDAKMICGVDTYNCHVNNEKFSLGVCRSMSLSNSQALRLPCAAKCDYLQRWKAAKDASQTITSYSYWLIQMNYVLEKAAATPPFLKRNLVICDEAHKLPDIIESHFACTVNQKTLDFIQRTSQLLSSSKMFRHILDTSDLFAAIDHVLHIQLKDIPQNHLDALINLKKEYAIFLASLVPIKEELAQKYLKGKSSIQELRAGARKLPREGKALLRLLDSIKDNHCKVEDYVDNINSHGIENLIVDGEQTESRTYHNLSDINLFHKHFAKFSDVRVYMSATLQADLLIKRWEIDPEKASIIDVNSGWDVKKSPIILCDVGDMSYRNVSASMKNAIKEIDIIFQKHPNERGIIHTTSNAVAEEILNVTRFNSRLVRYSTTKEKMEILEAWGSYPPNSVIIGPSLTTGIDLKDDLARFNIVIKLSFPNMVSALWAKRAEVLPHIYIGETASILEQSCGRTTRSIDDFSTSYILDSRTKTFVTTHRKYFSNQFLRRLLLKSEI